MNYKKLGKSDVKVSPVILGCWGMGGDYFGAAEDKDSIGAIQKAIELGINTFDTAELYGKGRSEKVLGEAIKGYDRSRLVIISKLWTDHMATKDIMRKACEASMKRMGVDYIDTYFLHYPVEKPPIGEIMENMTALREEGLIRSIGISNFSLAEMKKAMEYGRIDVIQPCYNLLWRYIDAEDTLNFCIKNEIGVIPYSTLAQGLLTGKYTKNSVIGDGRSHAALFQPENYEKCLHVAERVKNIAAKYGQTTASAAINWLINTPGITAPIVGARSAAQMQESFTSTQWNLSKEDYAEIDRISKEFMAGMPKYRLFFSKDIEK